MKAQFMVLFLLLNIVSAGLAQSSSGGLLASAGVSQIEGSAGGGLVPWAVLAGYDTKEQQSFSVASTYLDLSDLKLSVVSLAYSYNNRIELSVARQRLDSKQMDVGLQQIVTGAKLRLWGDLVYSAMGQYAVGVQHKRLLDDDLAKLFAAKTESLDLYFSGSKLFLGAVVDRNLLINTTFRYSNANELGFVGFGGKGGRDKASWLFEGSAAVQLNKNWLLGLEFRQKPSNISALKEDHWRDIFVSYFPNKKLSITAAYLDLGKVATLRSQRGFYLSLQSSF